MTIRLLAFSGSSRAGSINQGVLRAAMAGARRAGAEVTHLDLRSLGLPIYDGDLEARDGLPPPAVELKQTMAAHHGFLVACPEYNSGYTPLLKTAIDWASRRTEDEPPRVAFAGKVVGLMSASAGAFGGIRSLPSVRILFENLGAHCLPRLLAVGGVGEGFFDDEGRVADGKRREQLEALGAEVVRLAGALCVARAEPPPTG